MINEPVSEAAKDKQRLDDFVTESVEYVVAAGVAEADIRDALLLDIMNFLLMVAAADGSIDDVERARIASLFGYNLSEDEWMDYLQERGIGTEDFIYSPFYSCGALVAAENTHGGGDDTQPSLSQRYLELLDVLSAGSGLDGTQTTTTARDTMLNTLRHYAGVTLTHPWGSPVLASRMQQDKEEAARHEAMQASEELREIVADYNTRYRTFVQRLAKHGWALSCSEDDFLHDLRDFLLALSAVHTASPAVKATFIREHVGIEMDSLYMEYLIDQMDMRAPSFTPGIPASIRTYVAVEQILHHRGFPALNVNFSKILSPFEALGKALIGLGSKQQDAKWREYYDALITRIHDYIAQPPSLDISSILPEQEATIPPGAR